MKPKLKLFLSHAREDEEKVEKFYQWLLRAGYRPWMAEKDILPGESWDLAIQKAIREADFFLVFLSKNSINKRGFVQKEIKVDLDVFQEGSENDAYLIPILLEEPKGPEPSLLRSHQWVNFIEPASWTELMRVIRAGEEQRRRSVARLDGDPTTDAPEPKKKKKG